MHIMAKKKSTRARPSSTNATPALPEPVTRKTPLRRGGEFTQHLLATCAGDIEALCNQIVTIACALDVDDGEDALLRSAGMRIMRLSGVLSAYFNEDEVMTIDEAHRWVYESASRLPRGELGGSGMPVMPAEVAGF